MVWCIEMRNRKSNLRLLMNHEVTKALSCTKVFVILCVLRVFVV